MCFPHSLFWFRPLAYSTLADLVHHVRQHLPLNDLSLAVQLFAKNIDDESLPSSIQTMSCKLLLNLVDCIRSKSEQENGNGRDILMRMLEVLICLKHLIIAWMSCFVVCCQSHFTFSFLQLWEYVGTACVTVFHFNVSEKGSLKLCSWDNISIVVEMLYQFSFIQWPVSKQEIKCLSWVAWVFKNNFILKFTCNLFFLV